jgi:hypothetical protein
MIRQAIRGLVVVVAVVLLLEAAAGQQGTPDKVKVRDTKKDGTIRTYEGTLVLDKAGLRVVGGEKGDKLVATLDPADIVQFTPGELPGVDRGVILALDSAEARRTRKDYEAARLGYAELLKKGVPERTKRYLEYKVAQMTSKIADETADDEGWATQAEAAVKAWDAFLAEHKAGWEVWTGVRTYTRLLVELTRYDQAAQAWGTVARTAELPPNLAMEAALQGIDAQIRSRAAAAAETAARVLAKDTPPGSIKDRLAIYESAAKALAGGDPLSGLKDIEDRIAATRDPVVQAVGFSMRGELYLAANKHRDAMWEFLWVETVKNVDRDEVHKAVVRLVDVFKALPDEVMATRYREKLRRLRTNF